MARGAIQVGAAVVHQGLNAKDAFQLYNDEK